MSFGIYIRTAATKDHLTTIVEVVETGRNLCVNSENLPTRCPPVTRGEEPGKHHCAVGVDGRRRLANTRCNRPYPAWLDISDTCTHFWWFFYPFEYFSKWRCVMSSGTPFSCWKDPMIRKSCSAEVKQSCFSFLSAAGKMQNNNLHGSGSSCPTPLDVSFLYWTFPVTFAV